MQETLKTKTSLLMFEEELSHIAAVREWGQEQGMLFSGALKYRNFQDAYHFVKYRSNPPQQAKSERIARTLAEIPGVAYRAASAYGYKDCQITDSLLRKSYVGRTATVLHEGTHLSQSSNHQNLPHCLDEAIATYLGLRGAVEFCTENAPHHRQETEEKLKALTKYAPLINEYYISLRKGEDILSEAHTALKDQFFAGTVNAEWFSLVIDYTSCFPIVSERLDTIETCEYFENIDEVNESLIAEL